MPGTVSDTPGTGTPLPRISLADFDARRSEIAAELVAAAETRGVFELATHGVPSALIAAQYAAVARFFALPGALKDKAPCALTWNAHRESCQMRVADAGSRALAELSASLPGLGITFKEQTCAFMAVCDELLGRLAACLADALGEPPVARLYTGALHATHFFAKTGCNCSTQTDCDHGDHGDRGDHGDHGDHGEAHSHDADNALLALTFSAPHLDTDSDAEQESRILCSVGALLAEWSRGRFRPGTVMVRPPDKDKDKAGTGDRYSLAFVCQPAGTPGPQRNDTGRVYNATTGDYDAATGFAPCVTQPTTTSPSFAIAAATSAAATMMSSQPLPGPF